MLKEIDLTVIGRKSGRAISIPVWFVLEGDALYLLPGGGKRSQWYRNVLKHPAIRVAAQGVAAALDAAPITDAPQVAAIVASSAPNTVRTVSPTSRSAKSR